MDFGYECSAFVDGFRKLLKGLRLREGYEEDRVMVLCSDGCG